MRRHTDVIPINPHFFLVWFHRFETIPAEIGFDRYHHAECRIYTKDGGAHRQAGVIYRPKNVRNVAGERNTNQMVLLLEADMMEHQLAEATITLTAFGAELSSNEIMWCKRRITNQMDAQTRS